jgi:hypothetical protein
MILKATSDHVPNQIDCGSVVPMLVTIMVKAEQTDVNFKKNFTK